MARSQFLLPPKLKKQFDLRCTEEGNSMSSVVRYLVQLYLDKEVPPLEKEEDNGSP